MVKFVRKAFSSAKIGSRILGRLLKPILGSSKLAASIASSIEPLAFSILGRLLGIVEEALRFFLILGREGLARISLPAPSLWTRISARRAEAEAETEEEAYLVPEAQIVNLPMLFDLTTARDAIVGKVTRTAARLSVPKPFLPVVSEEYESVFTEFGEVSKIIIAHEIGEMVTTFQGYVRHGIPPYTIIPSPSFLGVVSGVEGRRERGVEPKVDVTADAGMMAKAGAEGEAEAEVKVEVEVEGERISPYLPSEEAMHAARVFGETLKEALAYAFRSLPKAKLPVFSQPQLRLWLQSQLQLQLQPQPQRPFPTLAGASLSPTFSYQLPYPYILPRALWSLLMEVPERIAPIAALSGLPTGSMPRIGIREGLGFALEPWILRMEELPLATFLTTPLVKLLYTPSYPYAPQVIAEAERIRSSLSAGESAGGLVLVPWRFSENLSLISRFAEETQRSLVLRTYEPHRLLGALHPSFQFPPLPSSLPLSRSLPLPLPLSYLPAITVPSPSHPLAFPATAAIFRLGQELLGALGEGLAQEIELPTGVSFAILGYPSLASLIKGSWDRFYLPNLEALPQALELPGALSRAMATMPVYPLKLMPFSVPWLKMGSQLSSIVSLALSFAPLEAQGLSLSYTEALAELGIFPIVREPMVVRMPSVSFGLSRALEPLARLPEGEYQRPTQAFSIPTPPISRLPAPVIQSTIHLTMPTDSEDDLRDLERKIARLLAEQIRRYYGNIRI